MIKGLLHKKLKSKIALGCDIKLKPVTQSQKFKLDLDVSPYAKDLQKIFYTVSGTQQGSLFDLVLSLKNLGFKFRDSGKKITHLYNYSKLKPTESNRTIKEFYSDSPKDFNVVALYQALTTPARSSADFTKEAIEKFLYIRMGGNYSGGMDNPLGRLCEQLASAFLESYKDWSGFNGALKNGEALTTFDKVSAKVGLVLPVKLSNVSIEPFPVKNSTVIYDVHNALDLTDFSLLKSEHNEFKLHCATALAVFDNWEEPFKNAKEAANHAKSHLTTANANAYSWLFGNGLKYFISTPEKQIAQDYDLPMTVASEIKFLVKEVPYEHLMGKGYSPFRTTLQSQLDSWISNYFNRLFDIKDILEKDELGKLELPKALSEEKAQYYFNNLPIDFSVLQSEIKRLQGKREKVMNDLLVLTGQVAPTPSFGVLEAITGLDKYQKELEVTLKTLNELKNRITKEIEVAEKTNREEDATFAKSCAFELKEFDFDKINLRHVEAVDYESDLKEKSEKMISLIKKAQQHIDKVIAETDSFATPMAAKIQREQSHIERLGKQDEISAEEQAIRHVWSYTLKQMRNLSASTKYEAIQRLKRLGLFKKSNPHQKSPVVNLHRFMNEFKGEIYISLFNPRRSHKYNIDLNLNPYQESKTLISELEKFVFQHATNNSKNGEKAEVFVKDWIQLQRMKFNLELDRLPAKVPSDLLKDPELVNSDNFPIRYKLSLDAGEEVGGDTARRILNHYTSLISLNMAFVMRNSFAQKFVFRQDKEIGMWWVPKKEKWIPPFTAERNPLWKSLMNEEKAIESSSILSLLKEQSVYDDKKLQALVKNYPHDLFVTIPFELQEKGTKLAGFAEKTAFNTKKLNIEKSARVVAPSKYKTILLDAMTLPKEQISLGGPTFIFEGFVKQNIDFSFDENDNLNGIKVSLSEPEWTTFFSQPIVSNPAYFSDGEVFDITQNLVSIDLGEVGIGYAVINPKTGEVIESGSKRLPSLAKLPKVARTARKRRQSRQGYQKVFSTELADMREKAIGELKFFIDNLMYHHNAFPVFESSVPRLRSDSREILTVYKTIMQYYTFSNIDAHKAERKNNWFGADKWTHPYLETQELVKDRSGKFTVKKDRKGNPVYKPLNLFPGTTVNPYGTSQTCSKCGVNALQVVKDWFVENKGSKLFLDDSGHVKVGDYTFKIEKRYRYEDLPEDEAKDLKRRNRRPPFGAKYRAGQYNESEILKMMKEFMRRPHDNMRSKDTSQSQFYCPNTDCGHHQHADENAAINIGQKFLKKCRHS